MKTTLPPHELLGSATSEEIAEEESKLGVKFAVSLKEFLLRHNGGWLYGNMVRLYSVGNREYSFTNENKGPQNVDDWPSKFVGFATDGGLGLFCFDSKSRRDDREFDLYYWSWEEREPEPVGQSLQNWFQHLEKLAPIRWARTTNLTD